MTGARQVHSACTPYARCTPYGSCTTYGRCTAYGKCTEHARCTAHARRAAHFTQPWQCWEHAAFELFAKQLKIVKIHYGKFAREVERLGRSLLLLLLVLFLLVLLLLLQEGRCSQALLLLLWTERGLRVGGAARVTLALCRIVKKRLKKKTLLCFTDL